MVFGPVLLTPRLLFWFAGALLAGALTQTVPAFADLRVCNQTSNQVSIALGYRAERGWESEGWWVAPPGQCAVVYQGDLSTVNSSFFYIFAADDVGGGAWDGPVFMCTRDESFTIFDVDDCLARGYERTGFFEVDTKHRSDWMLQLVQGAGSPSDDGGADQTIPLDAIAPPPEGETPPADEVPLDGGGDVQ